MKAYEEVGFPRGFIRWVREGSGESKQYVCRMSEETMEKIKAQHEREWQGIGSDEEILELSKDAWGRDRLFDGRTDLKPFYIAFARTIEAKLKEKNTCLKD